MTSSLRATPQRIGALSALLADLPPPTYSVLLEMIDLAPRREPAEMLTRREAGVLTSEARRAERIRRWIEALAGGRASKSLKS